MLRVVSVYPFSPSSIAAHKRGKKGVVRIMTEQTVLDTEEENPIVYDKTFYLELFSQASLSI
jgi:hypothetical protein